MTRKDYVLIAAEIRDTRAELGADVHKALDGLTDRLCTALRAENSRFDADKFRRAAGYGGSDGD